MAKVHRTELPYDPLPRSIAQDSGMSFDALAIYAWARSLPDGAELSVEEVVRQDRGIGMPRARRAVTELRDRGLWHTVTIRTNDADRPIISMVVVPPDPWPRHKVLATLDIPDGRIVDNPPPPPLRGVPAGQPDREVSNGQQTDGQVPDGQKAAGPSLEQSLKNYPPPPAARGSHRCAEGHATPRRGCCARRDRATAATRASASERRSWPRWCGNGMCNPETRLDYDTREPCPSCHPSTARRRA